MQERPEGITKIGTKKNFIFSPELTEALRRAAFEERCKEIDIVRRALDKYLKRTA